MRIAPRLALALLLVTGTATAARAHSVCGTATGADGAALPASARAELRPMERSYDWELGLLAGREGNAPAGISELANGRFCLEATGPGPWKVVVRAPGFVTVSRFPLPVTGPVELPHARLSPDRSLAIRLTRSREGAGDGAGAAWVLARPADRDFWTGLTGEGWRPDLRFVRVGADGAGELSRAPGEVVDLEVLARDSSAAASLRVAAGEREARLTLTEPSTTRTLVVVDEHGEPLGDVAVALLDHGWPVGVTDGRGRTTLRVLPSADLSLLLEAADGRRRIVRLPPRPAATDGETPAPVQSPTKVVLSPNPPARGRVVDTERRQAVAGALVWVGPDPGTSAVTGEDGGFSLPGGGRDRLRLEAAAADHLPRAIAVAAAELAAGRLQEIALPPAGAAVGRVVDADGAPLAAVTVAAAPEEGNRSRAARGTEAATRARTGTDGRFRLSGLRRGLAYRVTASRDGFVTRTLPGVVLPPHRPSADLGTVVLRPGVRLTGRVVDPRGHPIEGAEVRTREAGGLPVPAAEARLRERDPDAVSDPDGRFVLADLAAGRPLDLLTTARGHQPAWTLAVEVPASEPPTVVLAESARLSGVLADRDGAPVAGAAVGVHWEGPPAGTVGLEPLRPPSRGTETDARGRFAFDELTPGNVHLFTRPEGFLPLESRLLTLPAGGELADVRLVVDRGAAIAGHVFGPDGAVVAGAEVRVEAATTTSGAEGDFRLGGVEPGERVLFVYHPDFRHQVREVRVEPGENAVDVYLEEGWAVSGRTVDETGAPVAGAVVKLRPERADAVSGYRTSSDDDGRFRIVVSEEGTFRATAFRDGFAPGEVGGLDVHGASIDGVEVTLSRGMSVVGRILGLPADELAGVTVEARRVDGGDGADEVIGSVDPEGRYTVARLARGYWRLAASLDGDRRQAGATVALDGSAREVSRDLEFGNGVRFTGHLFYAGEPISGAHVLVSGLTVSGERSVLSGHDGAFRVEDLEPGSYRLDVLDRSRALSYVEDLELRADRDLQIELESAPLVGTVTAADSGEPLDEAMVTVRRVLAASGDTGPLTTVPTDPTGAFVVAHLTPGDYLVSARKDGFAPAEQPLRVEAGVAPAPALLRLAPTGGVTLTVHLASGEVPLMATVSAFDAAGHLAVNDTRRVSDRGFVHFGQIPPGTWNLLVSAAGAAPTWVTAEVPDSAPEVVLPPAAALVVRVPALMATDAAGTLAVSQPNGDPFFQVDPTGQVQSRWTLSGGLVTLADVPAGVWTLRVDGADGGTWQGTAVTDGRSASEVSLE